MTIFSQLVPFCHERRTEQELVARLASHELKAEMDDTLPASWRKYRQLGLADLKEALKSDLSRREALQRRAPALLGSIALMSAIALGSANLLRSDDLTKRFEWSMGFVLVATVAYLTGAAWWSLRLLRPGSLYDLFLQDRMPDDTSLDEDALKAVALECIFMNQTYNLLFSIYGERSFRCMRNGLIGLVCFLFLLFTSSLAFLHVASSATQ